MLGISRAGPDRRGANAILLFHASHLLRSGDRGRDRDSVLDIWIRPGSRLPNWRSRRRMRAISSSSRPAASMATRGRWVAADGARMGRESMNLRGQVFELDSSGKAGADGLPSAITIRGVTPQGDAAETLHHQQRDGRVEEPGRRRHRELFAPGVLRLARRTDRHDGLVPRSAAGDGPTSRSTCCPAAKRARPSWSISRSAPARQDRRSRSGRSPASAPRRCRSGRTRTTSSSP